MEEVNLIMPKVVDKEIPANTIGRKEDEKNNGDQYVTIGVVRERNNIRNNDDEREDK